MNEDMEGHVCNKMLHVYNVLHIWVSLCRAFNEAQELLPNISVYLLIRLPESKEGPSPCLPVSRSPGLCVWLSPAKCYRTYTPAHLEGSQECVDVS
jgi:hypothetical protein